MQRLHIGLTLGVGVVAGAILSSAIAAQADGAGEPPRTIPYSGYVDFDGQPVNAGSVKFNFGLFPCPTPGSGVGQCQPLWLAKGAWANGWPAGQYLQLPVFAGRFTVELGATGQTELPDQVFQAGYEVLYLGMQIEEKTLGTLQKIVPTPRALASSEADRFRVRTAVELDDLTGAGSARLTADGGLVIDHTNGLQDELLRVGSASPPPLTVSQGGAAVHGELTVDDLTATRVHVTEVLTGPSDRLAVGGVVTAQDVYSTARAGLVYDSNERLDGRFVGGTTYAVVDGLPVLSLTGGYVDVLPTARYTMKPYSGTGYAVAAWFKRISATPADMVLIGVYECQQNGLSLDLLLNGKIVFNIRGDSGEFSDQSATSTATFNDTAWHHVVGVRDPATSKVLLYVDGALAGQGQLTNTSGHSADLRFWIGSTGYCDGSTAPFRGYLDAVRVYQRALSATEVAAFYNATRPLHP